MEVAGLVDCFMNSIANRKLHYRHYTALGMVTQKHLVKNDPYSGIVVEKECVGQKRLGSCLRNLKGPLTDGKTLGLSFA